MKSLKITLLAIFCIALLSAVSQSNDANMNDNDYEKLKQNEVKLTLEVKKKRIPSQA